MESTRKQRVIFDNFCGAFYKESLEESLNRASGNCHRSFQNNNRSQTVRLQSLHREVEATRHLFTMKNQRESKDYTTKLQTNLAHIRVLQRHANKRQGMSKSSQYGKYAPMLSRHDLQQQIQQEIARYRSDSLRLRETKRLLNQRQRIVPCDRTLPNSELFKRGSHFKAQKAPFDHKDKDKENTTTKMPQMAKSMSVRRTRAQSCCGTRLSSIWLVLRADLSEMMAGIRAAIEMDVFRKEVINPKRFPAHLQYGPAARGLTQTKDPKMWQIMSRVNDPQKDVALDERPPSEKKYLRRCSKKGGFRLWEHYKCTCHQQADEVIRSVCKPESRFWERASVRKTEHGFVRRIHEDLKMNAIPGFPLSTVLVRWRPDVVQYDLKSIHGLLSVFGQIVQMQHVNATRVVIVFAELASSCRLLSAVNFLSSVNSLYCTWWHKCMQSKRFDCTFPGGIRVFHNIYIEY